ncbi:hypothetical protein DL768_005007 [Monosporascus sp. mg162]|nr:hypothetical protein DL768_005007 [Monosporascus sp. mg162]
MSRTTQTAKKASIDPEDAIRLEEPRRQVPVEKEERLLASIRKTVGYWNIHAPKGVRPSSVSRSTSYQEDREPPTMWPRVCDEEDLESSSHIRAPVNARQNYRSDRLNPLRQSPQPSVRDSYNNGYGLAGRRLPRRPSTDVLELRRETEVEAASTPSPSTKYEISQQTLSDDFHVSRPYSGSQEAEGGQAQPVLTVLRTTTRVYQVHRVPPAQSRGSAHRRDYDSERAPEPSCSDLQRTGTREYTRAQTPSEDWQAQGSSSLDFDQRHRYQTRKLHGWDEDWAAETTGDEVKGPQHGSSTSVSLYSYGNQAQPSGAKRSRSWDDGKEEILDEDAINDEDDGVENRPNSRSTFTSRKRLRLS